MHSLHWTFIWSERKKRKWNQQTKLFVVSEVSSNTWPDLSIEVDLSSLVWRSRTELTKIKAKVKNTKETQKGLEDARMSYLFTILFRSLPELYVFSGFLVVLWALTEMSFLCIRLTRQVSSLCKQRQTVPQEKESWIKGHWSANGVGHSSLVSVFHWLLVSLRSSLVVLSKNVQTEKYYLFFGPKTLVE
jgi:hypothetical protein